VTGWDAKEEHGGAILHEVTFSDGDVAEYSYTEVVKCHENYLQAHTTQPVFHLQLPNLSSSVQALTHAHQGDSIIHDGLSLNGDPTTAARPLPLPRSFASYPLRLPFEGSMMQAEITERHINPHGIHE
jgi:hypothetical protein